MSKQDTQSDLPFAPTAADIEREIVSTTRGRVYNDLKTASAEARQRGDLDKAEKLQDLRDDATRLDPSLWRDLFRVRTRSKFDSDWWHSLIRENPGQFESLRDAIIQYATICDAEHQRGETKNLDERFFPSEEKVMEDHRRYWDERAEDHRQRGAELRRRHYAEIGLAIPDDE